MIGSSHLKEDLDIIIVTITLIKEKLLKILDRSTPDSFQRYVNASV